MASCHSHVFAALPKIDLLFTNLDITWNYQYLYKASDQWNSQNTYNVCIFKIFLWGLRILKTLSMRYKIFIVLSKFILNHVYISRSSISICNFLYRQSLFKKPNGQKINLKRIIMSNSVLHGYKIFNQKSFGCRCTSGWRYYWIYVI